MKAVNANEQKQINVCVEAYYTYLTLRDYRRAADEMGDIKLFNRFNNKCHRAFQVYLELCAELSKKQKKALNQILDIA